MNNIIWKDIYINEILTNYEVSNTGLVRNKINGKILKPIKNSAIKAKYDNEYVKVSIYINKILNQINIHRLVAKAFIPNDDPEHKTQVNHINGIKYDNRVENLEWCTASENTKHAYDIGLAKGKYGEEHPNNKYPEKLIHQICKLLENKVPMKLILLLLNIFKALLNDIKNGYYWNQISSQYNINHKENYNYQKIKYTKLRKILLDLNIFNDIDLFDLLYSKYITHKRKLIKDLEDKGYEIFIDSKLYKEFKRDYYKYD